MLHLPSATLAAICASPPIGPDKNLDTLNPAFSALVPVVPVETKLIKAIAI